MNSLNEISIDFKCLEEEVFSYVCKLGVEIIRAILVNLDQRIVEERDNKRYRHKGLKANTIKTVMGPVEYRRAIYEKLDDDGKKQYIYLLDEYLNMKTIGKMSGMLVEKVLENVSEKSYRKSAANVTSLTGQSISHGAAWGLVQKFGQKLGKEEDEKIERFKRNELNGEREVDVLFMESDGIWLSMQRKDRPQKDRSGKRELKIGIHYEGWEERYKGAKKKTYVVKNKGAVAGFADPEKFKLMRDTNIAEEYNYDEIKHKILNGDGASWIKSGHDGEGELFQLDRYHVAEAIVKNIRDKEEVKKLLKMYRNCQFKSFMDRLTELKYECGGLYEEVKRIEVLEKYLVSNREGIVPYQKRVELPKPPPGLYYRNLGTMESNVYNIIGHRMKGRKMSWSIKGANNLSKILATKISGKLYDKISSLLSSTLPQKALEVYETVINNVKEHGKDIGKKIKIYPVHEANRPFTGVPLTEGRKAIRKLLEERPLTELIYR